MKLSTKIKLQEMIRQIVQEESLDSKSISSFIRHLGKQFNLRKMSTGKLILNSKRNIPKLQDYLRNNKWVQSKYRKDEWFKTFNGQEYLIRIDSNFGILIFREA
jgi:hemin uptake protein HemP